MRMRGVMVARIEIVVELPEPNSSNPLTGSRAEIIRYALMAGNYMAEHWKTNGRVDYVSENTDNVPRTIATSLWAEDE